MYFKVDITGYFVLLKVGKINLLILNHRFKIIKPKLQFWLIHLRPYICTKMSIWTHSAPPSVGMDTLTILAHPIELVLIEDCIN